MLSVEGLRVSHGRVEAIHGVDLEVRAGEAVGLIGSNGAGKTTLLRAICGLLPASQGTVRFDGELTIGTAAFELARRGLAFVPAQRRLFPTLSVVENLSLGAYPHRPDRARRDEVFALFPRLAERRSQAAGTLSGGEQQMLAIGRALMSRPRLLLLDEPSTGLAPRIAEDAYAALGALRELGLTLLVAEQQVPLALASTARTYVLEHGRVLLEGASAALRDDERVRRAYLGHR